MIKNFLKSEIYYDLDAFIREYDGKIPVVIFGTGNYGEFIINKLNDAGRRVDCFTCIFEDMRGSKNCDTDVAALSSVIGLQSITLPDGFLRKENRDGCTIFALEEESLSAGYEIGKPLRLSDGLLI